jgi:hypothetical protein
MTVSLRKILVVEHLRSRPSVHRLRALFHAHQSWYDTGRDIALSLYFLDEAHRKNFYDDITMLSSL